MTSLYGSPVLVEIRCKRVFGTFLNSFAIPPPVFITSGENVPLQLLAHTSSVRLLLTSLITSVEGRVDEGGRIGMEDSHIHMGELLFPPEVIPPFPEGSARISLSRSDT
eukprot:sb/3477480/